MNEGSGSTAYDLSGNANHGTLHGFSGSYRAQTPFGAALRFDGTDDYVSIPDRDAYSSSQFTVALKLRPQSLLSGYRALVTRWDNLNDHTSNEWDLFITSSGALNGGVGMATGIWQAGAESSAGVIAVDTCYSLVLVYDQANVVLAVNGTQVASVARTNVVKNCGYPILVGCSASGEYSNTDMWDLRYYSKALPANAWKAIARGQG